MCMPGTDQAIQTIRQHINDAMKWVRTQALQRQRQGDEDACNRCWTKAIRAALCAACQAAWGKCNPLRICAADPVLPPPPQATVCSQPLGHICVTQAGPTGFPANMHGRWLYGVTCLKHNGPWPAGQQVLLAAEVTVGSHDIILDRLAKLLVARAEVRVLVCEQDFIRPFQDLANSIHQCHDTQAGDIYLLAAFWNHAGQSTNRLLSNRRAPAANRGSMRTRTNPR